MTTRTATQEQVNQLIARFLIKLKPEMFDHSKTQTFVGDPEGIYRFTKFINSYERECFKIDMSDFAEPDLPEWSRGRVLVGDIRRPKSIDFVSVISSAYFHPHQKAKKYKGDRPSGHDILKSLVSCYDVRQDKVDNIYEVSETDLIHGHFGLAELIYMENNWDTLPESFRVWSKGKSLRGWRDVVRNPDGYLRVPCLECHISHHPVYWYELDARLGVQTPALRERVG